MSGPGVERWTGGALEAAVRRSSAPAAPASPPPAGRAGEELGASPPRGGAGGRARADPAGWAGDARRSGAPHRPRRLARAPTVPAAAGGGSQAAGGGGEAEEAEAGAPLAADSLPRLSRERYRAPAPGPRPPGPEPPALARAGRGCGRHGRVRGPERPRGLRRPGSAAASAAPGREGWSARRCRRFADSGGRRAPLARVRGSGGPAGWGDPGAGGCAGQAGARGWRAGRTPGAACRRGVPRAPGGRARWAQTKPGAGAPRRLGRSRGWALGRGEKAPGRRPGHGESLRRPPSGCPGGLEVGRRAGWGAALSEGPSRESGWERGRVY